MNIIYILSVIYVMLSFVIYKKSSEKISLITSIIYTISLGFCYNVLIVLIASVLKIGGSLLSYSLINFFVGTICNVISFRRKEKN